MLFKNPIMMAGGPGRGAEATPTDSRGEAGVPAAGLQGWICLRPASLRLPACVCGEGEGVLIDITECKAADLMINEFWRVNQNYLISVN